MKKNCWKLQSQTNQQQKEDGKTLVTISHDVVVFSVREKDCLHIADQDAEWVVDIATSYHSTPHKNFFTLYKARNFGTVRMGNTSNSKIVGIEDIQIKTKVGCTMVLKDVWHVPNLRPLTSTATRVASEMTLRSWQKVSWLWTRNISTAHCTRPM